MKSLASGDQKTGFAVSSNRGIAGSSPCYISFSLISPSPPARSRLSTERSIRRSIPIRWPSLFLFRPFPVLEHHAQFCYLKPVANASIVCHLGTLAYPTPRPRAGSHLARSALSRNAYRSRRPHLPSLEHDDHVARTRNTSQALLNPSGTKTLRIFRGGTIPVQPKRRRDTILVCMSSDEVDEGQVQINLTLMDGMKARSNVVLMAATTRPNPIDPALRRFGRFDDEIDSGNPDPTGPSEILRIHTKNMHSPYVVDLEQIAANTHRYLRSNNVYIALLCSEAAMRRIREKMDLIKPYEDTTDVEVMESVRLALDINTVCPHPTSTSRPRCCRICNSRLPSVRQSSLPRMVSCRLLLLAALALSSSNSQNG